MTTTRFFSILTEQSKPSKSFAIDIFSPLRQWLNRIEFSDRQFAEKICNLIPASCPFERDVSAFGYTYHIPALCKINPVFEEVVNLRLRALIYLSELPS
ncbi:MAG: nitrogenase [Pseudanabaena sp.]|nr:MAG: nitrogenase [Pseudanabaena sp.]